MTRGLLRWAMLCLTIAIALAAGAARADTAVALYKSFAGNVNFTGAQATMRDKNNNRPCSVVSPSTTLTATLAGIPAGATVVSAQLYWAGSGSQGDYSVNFDGAQVTAGAARRYSSATIGAGYDYFSGAADVTAQVAAKGNGNYAVSGLTIANGEPWCSVEGVVGGFSLLVVYSSAAEPFRVLNLYEGFQYFRYSGFTVNLGNFLVPKTLTAAMTARLGHITWEGDATLNQGGEDLLFNGAGMTDPMNPSGNQFNSASNIDGDTRSWGIDFDAYTIAPSSGLFKAGQSSATTRYQSGQDMVLLSAEVIAMPNVPTADLSITMSRGSPLVVGTDTPYTLTVANLGPNPESGPVTVTDTVPAGMTLSSAGGAGWSCGASGQTVTCGAAGPLAAGATLPPLALVLRPGATGTYTNTASVAGQMYDNLPANNTASNSANASASAASYVFTSTRCAAGAPVGSAGCLPFAGPVTAASAAPVYVTAVSGSPALATAPNASSDTALALRFALSCVDPVKDQGVSATLAGAAMPLCAANGATPTSWSQPASLVFPAGSASALATPGFEYGDVGSVTLSLLDPAGRSASVTFVVKPSSLAFQAIRRSSDGAPNPAQGSNPRPGFARAGEAFTLVVGARTAAGKWAPNFGNEKDAQWWPQIRLQQVQERELPAVQGAFESAAGGFVTGTGFWWDEAGTVNLAPVMRDYLGAGRVTGDAADVGRFYPDHFATAAFPAFPCLKAMPCPAPSVTGGAYSAQPFKVEVHALGMTGKALSNYSGVTVTLAAFDAAGGTNANPRGGTLSANTAVSAIGDPAASANPQYLLPAMFNYGAPRANNWTAPAAVWMRASAPETVVDAGGTARSVTITSRLAAGSPEGGLLVVNGRLLLANAFGSELLKLPVRMNAQFWTGSAWDNNGNDNTSLVAYSGNLVFSDCQGGLLDGAGGCNAALLSAPAAPALALKAGAGSFTLPAPGQGKAGSAWLRIKDGNPPWLPSTRARATFGVYQSPLIYMREVH